MQLYDVSCGNPEGTDFTHLLQHEKVFTQDEFQELCEQAFCYSLEKQYKEYGDSFIMNCSEDVYNFLKTKGFVDPPKVINYYLEPYWGKERIKSEKLKKLIDKPGKGDCTCVYEWPENLCKPGNEEIFMVDDECPLHGKDHTEEDLQIP